MFETLDEETKNAFEEALEALPEADEHFADGDQILDTDLQVLHGPGHTPGSVCFYSEERSALFSGDTLFFKSIGATDIPDGSSEQLLQSIKQKIFPLPPETRLFPGHGPLSTVEREKSNNPALRAEGLV
jgi:glyoxylase-like metal-dependent hydrolase (beta-lactamase superfamily II)